MNTKLVGMKEFRNNISKYAQKAGKGDTRFVVMRRNIPLFELKPLSEEDGVYAKYVRAKKDLAEGRVHSHDEIRNMFA